MKPDRIGHARLPFRASTLALDISTSGSVRRGARYAAGRRLFGGELHALSH
jgi:hypothetical protein